MCLRFRLVVPWRGCFLIRDPPTTATYTLSLHDALPISCRRLECEARARHAAVPEQIEGAEPRVDQRGRVARRSEEHTSELQSHSELVCRLLLEKKKRNELV